MIDFMFKAGAAMAAGLAAVSGVETVKTYTTPVAVEGSGYYSQPVRAGDLVGIQWTIVKRVDCPGVAGRVWSGGNGFYLSEPLRSSGLPTSDEPREYNISTVIPHLSPAGPLELLIKGTYHCPDRDVNFSLGPVFLEVVE